jgi:1-acyl-sn-glycerol-3-phosphate acyltransferase
MMSETSPNSSGYFFARRLVRAWLNRIHGKIRLLRSEAMPASGPVILVASSPAGLRQALVLVAALERPVSCLIEVGRLRGLLAGWVSRKLGMIPYEPTKDGIVTALKVARARLEQGEVVAILAGESARRPAEPSMGAQMAATLALSTAPRLAGKPLTFLPTHILLPIAPSPRREVLMCLSAPHLLDVASLPAERAPATRQIAVELSRALRENPFCLPPQDVETVLKDLEEVLRSELEEDWAGRADWKQKLDGFELSRFVADWLEQLGAADPGRLIAWRHELNMHREELRQWSLRQAEVEAAGSWFRSPLARAWYGLESIAGFPLALYGLLNHLLAGVVLFASGLLKKQRPRDPRVEWALRAALVLGCYVAQTLLCAHAWGRAAAGYYALTLPVSGAFLWRYRWLLRARTRLLLLSMRLPARAAAIAGRRRKLIAELNAARDRHAEESLSVRSPESGVRG